MKNIFLVVIIGIALCLINHSIFAQRVLERGLAEKILDGMYTGKRLALHRTIPPGTIIRIKNAETGLTTRAKVVSKLPNIEANKKIIVKLSQAACEALNATGLRFAVEISKAPQELDPPDEDEILVNQEDEFDQDEEVIKHEVMTGETLYSISKKYNVQVADIKDWNALDSNVISIGQILTIFKP